MTNLPPEFDFIDWVRQRARSRPEVRVPIGDDAAVLEADGRTWLTAVDVITEGVHFSLDATPPELVGRKALAINLSDIAAMAGEPCAAFVGIVLPGNRPRSFAEAVFEGLFALAEEWNVSIAGGDTNTWDGPLVISVTLLGLADERGPVLRSGACPGDWILVTGGLGGSLQSGRHLTFTPRIREARALHAAADLHAMIDLSDGLASDLFHLLSRPAPPGVRGELPLHVDDQAGAGAPNQPPVAAPPDAEAEVGSNLGAVLDGDAIPIHDDVPQDLDPEARLHRALNDGEDFELLLAVSPEEGERLLRDPPFETPLTRIGEITAAPEVLIRLPTGTVPLPRGGWGHRFETGLEGKSSS
jgi:thiamine-monophosphate kinase